MRVRKIASVARIHISDDDAVIAEKKLSDIYEWIKSIKEIDVSGTEPLYNINEEEYRTVCQVENPEFYSPSLALVNTPSKADDFIIVPKVIE